MHNSEHQCRLEYYCDESIISEENTTNYGTLYAEANSMLMISRYMLAIGRGSSWYWLECDACTDEKTMADVKQLNIPTPFA